MKPELEQAELSAFASMWEREWTPVVNTPFVELESAKRGWLARAAIAHKREERLTNELLRLRDVVCEQDVESIDAALAKESSDAKAE